MLYSQSDDRRNFGRGDRGQLRQTQERNPYQWQADRNGPKEGGVITPDHPSVTTHPNADIVENTTTMKRCAGKRHETRLQLATGHKLRIELRLRRS